MKPTSTTRLGLALNFSVRLLVLVCHCVADLPRTRRCFCMRLQRMLMEPLMLPSKPSMRPWMDLLT